MPCMTLSCCAEQRALGRLEPPRRLLPTRECQTSIYPPACLTPRAIAFYLYKLFTSYNIFTFWLRVSLSTLYFYSSSLIQWHNRFTIVIVVTCFTIFARFLYFEYFSAKEHKSQTSSATEIPKLQKQEIDKSTGGDFSKSGDKALKREEIKVTSAAPPLS